MYIKRSGRCKRSFTLIEIMVTVLIIVIVALIAIANMMRMKAIANESASLVTLRAIAGACEAYAAANGSYPTSIANLTDLDPAYLNEDYTSGSRFGYFYNCTFSSGYTCTATPSSCNTTGTKTFTIITGEAFSSSGC